ncbi:Beta-galactoside alpha 2_6-sialyltransferase ST6Gal I/II, partial [Caligus rogercresseyi]
GLSGGDDGSSSHGSIVRIKFDETTGRFRVNDNGNNAYDSPGRVNTQGSELYELLDENYFLEESEEMNRLKGFEKQVISNLRRTFMDYGKKVLSGEMENRFKVRYNGRKGALLEIEGSSEELLCDMKKKVVLKIFQRGDLFFRSQQLDQYFMPEPLFSPKRTYNTCAIVTSAGSLINSELGPFIDSHDFVMRFNDAPTFGHEKDVGSKTSLRVVNSQILSRPEFGFLDPKNLYSHSPVLVWDPTNYNVSIGEWYSNVFLKATHEAGGSPLSPSSRKPLSHSKWPLVPNPPTTGFIGLALSTQQCKVIRVFEYIPSLRYSDKCHYYGSDYASKDGSGGPCTYGAWHPVSAEKLMALALNVGKKKDIYAHGYLTIPGLLSTHCPSS